VANLSDAYGRSHGNEDWTVWEPWLDDGQTVHAEVGSYRANPFGLHDVYGNVWEWCLDGYDGGFYGRGPKVDPVVPWTGSPAGVYRGGGFNAAAVIARSAYRGYYAPEFADGGLGVRPARGITP
jgi:formylglycine-generating enzyme required for sulfatase activity